MANGFHDFTAGDVFTAANADKMWRQGVQRFDDVSDRDTQLSGHLEDGMVVYEVDQDRLSMYNGSSWIILRESRQTWTPTVTAGTAATGTVNRGWYVRHAGTLFTAKLKWTWSSGGSPASEVVISTPVTLANTLDIAGYYRYYDDSIGNWSMGNVAPISTTTFKLDDGQGTDDFLVVTLDTDDFFEISITGTTA